MSSDDVIPDADEPQVASIQPPTDPDLKTLRTLVEEGQWLNLATFCENKELQTLDTEPKRILLLFPLILAYLILDETPLAQFALRRLPNPIAVTPVPQALFSLTASVSERIYSNVHPRALALGPLLAETGLEVELGALVNVMLDAFLVTFRKRTMDLLSHAYASIATNQLELLLGIPTQDVITDVPDWSYDSSTSTFTLPKAAEAQKVFQPSSLMGFDDVATIAAHLESTF